MFIHQSSLNPQLIHKGTQCKIIQLRTLGATVLHPLQVFASAPNYNESSQFIHGARHCLFIHQSSLRPQFIHNGIQFRFERMCKAQDMPVAVKVILRTLFDYASLLLTLSNKSRNKLQKIYNGKIVERWCHKCGGMVPSRNYANKKAKLGKTFTAPVRWYSFLIFDYWQCDGHVAALAKRRHETFIANFNGRYAQSLRVVVRAVTPKDGGPGG